MQDPVQKAQVIDAYARSISVIWIVMTPVVGVSFILGEFFVTLPVVLSHGWVYSSWS